MCGTKWSFSTIFLIKKDNKNAAKWNCDKISVLDYDKMAAKPKKRKKDLQ